jgi:hypothetical protein
MIVGGWEPYSHQAVGGEIKQVGMHYQAQGDFPRRIEWGLLHGHWQGSQTKSDVLRAEVYVDARAEERKAYLEKMFEEMQYIWEMTAESVTAALRLPAGTGVRAQTWMDCTRGCGERAAASFPPSRPAHSAYACAQQEWRVRQMLQQSLRLQWRIRCRCLTSWRKSWSQRQR